MLRYPKIGKCHTILGCQFLECVSWVSEHAFAVFIATYLMILINAQRKHEPAPSPLSNQWLAGRGPLMTRHWSSAVPSWKGCVPARRIGLTRYRTATFDYRHHARARRRQRLHHLRMSRLESFWHTNRGPRRRRTYARTSAVGCASTARPPRCTPRYHSDRQLQWFLRG